MEQEISVSKKSALKKMSLKPLLVVGVIVMVLLALIGCYWFIKKPSASSYHAVFLSNGQVYFAQMNRRAGDFMTLTDVYYLRIQKTLQPEEGEEQKEQSSVSLVKLGSELHGPEDKMVVNKDHILFTEPLKSDSKVVEAIRKEKEGKKEE